MIHNKNRLNYHNKDTRVKIGLHNHGNLLLKQFNIDDEIKEIEEKDITTLEGKNLKLDYRAKLLSGKQLNIEGESENVRIKQLRKAFGYSKEVYCQTKEEVISIIIALADGKNQKSYDEEYCTSFRPYLFEAKKYDGEKYLNIYKNKVQNKEFITDDDCAIINLIPEMKFHRDMSEVVTELCEIVKNGIIAEDNQRELITVMNLNIDYFVIDKNQRNKLKEMLKVDDAFLPEYNRIIRLNWEEGKAEGIAEGRIEGIVEGKAEGIVEGKAEGIVEGRIEGIAEGKAEGIAEGKAESIKLEKENIDLMLDKIHENPNITIDEITEALINRRKALDIK